MKRLIWILLLIALFFRVYRVGDLTGFYFDQGRDALVIWDLWHSGKLFLTGPTTGIEGIFLGPFYYYLIAPFYLIGGGNPVFPAAALAVINVAAIYVLYRIGQKYFHEGAALLAVFFVSFSFQLTYDQRWLSNPTPLPLFSAVAFLLLLRLIHKSVSGLDWFLLGLMLGLSLHFEAASAVFFLPATFITFLVFRRRIDWGHGGWLHLLFSFLLTLIPQLWFNYRHDNILFRAFREFLVTDKSFTPVVSDFYGQRLAFYFESFFTKIFSDVDWSISFALFLLTLMVFFHRRIFSDSFRVVLIWLVTPLVLLLFYHGNSGYIWSYYFTGIYSLFVLLVAWILSSGYLVGGRWVKSVIGLFVLVFAVTNIHNQYLYLTDQKTSDPPINLGVSRAAVDRVYQDAAGRPFNVDVYVPPVVPHAYDYLFLWRGNTRYHTLPETSLAPLLYLVYEQDPPHPERLQAWLDRQDGYAVPDTSFTYGGVTVERRWRSN